MSERCAGVRGAEAWSPGGRRAVLLPGLLAASALVVSLLAAPAVVSGADRVSKVSRLLREANRAQARDPRRAAQGYLKLVRLGLVNEDLYFNLGTALLRSGDLGRARLYLERARYLSPWDRGVSRNLSAVRKRVSKLLPGKLRDKGSDHLRRVLWTFPAHGVAVLLLVLVCGLAGVLILRWRRAMTDRARGLGQVLTGLVIACLLVGGLLAARLHDQRTNREAVLLTPKTGVHKGPDTSFKRIIELPAGTKVTILARQDGWVRISAAGILDGWVTKGRVEPLW